MLPHRISPVPRRVDMGPAPFDWSKHGRGLGCCCRYQSDAGIWEKRAEKVHRITDVTKASCCFDRSQCVKHRSHWKQGGHSVELFQIADPSSGKEETVRDSFALVAGEEPAARSSACNAIPTGERCVAATTPPPGPPPVDPNA